MIIHDPEKLRIHFLSKNCYLTKDEENLRIIFIGQT